MDRQPRFELIHYPEFGEVERDMPSSQDSLYDI